METRRGAGSFCNTGNHLDTRFQYQRLATPATVPGTVLTTMIARGIYPDPDYGLNNLDIPESLNRQNYWYRAEFASPAGRDSHVSLVLDGINYHAEVWFNGQHLGSMTGAFIRGSFDINHLLRAVGKNALAILISPAPHPGIPRMCNRSPSEQD